MKNKTIETKSVKDNAIINVYVRGGVVQDIINIPKGVKVKLMDYDIENFSDQELQENTDLDEEGNRCVISIWGD